MRLPMRWVPVTVSLSLLSACDPPVAKYSDADIEYFRTELPGISDSCLRRLKYTGLGALMTPTETCYAMEPIRRWRGLWRRDFELSRFCPAPTKNCDFPSPGEFVWLSHHGRHESAPPHKQLYAIDFYGRRTSIPGSFGHLGTAQREIVVDRLVSLQIIPEEFSRQILPD